MGYGGRLVMLLTATQLHHTYSGLETPVQALRGVDFTIQRGDFCALMGPSGCGKSTLLQLCGAMEPPTRGELVFDGVPLHSAPDEVLTQFRRDKVGFVFQSFNLLPTLTVLENIALPLRLAGSTVGISETKAKALLDRVGLASRASHFPAQLSGGERQRVAMARALVHEPLLVIADEPTGSLDSENGRSIVALLQEMNAATGVTILLATHDASVAAAARTQLRMRDGVFVNDAHF